MTGLLLCMAAGAATFFQQDLPGIYAGGPNPLTGAAVTNFRLTDLDGDGAKDLVLPDYVALQRAGAFPPEARLPLPQAENALIDVSGPSVYVWRDGRLRVLEWSAQESASWRAVVDQDLPWPSAPRAIQDLGLAAVENSPSAQFVRFLHDFDGDAQPEIAVVCDDGIHVYARDADGTRFAEAGVMNILPALRYSHSTGQPLWPQDARRLLIPVQEMDCRVWFAGDRVTVLRREDLREERASFHITRYKVDIAAANGPIAAKTGGESAGPLPAAMAACRLNSDDIVDYAGGDWDYATSSALPVPVFETIASTDGGARIQRVRTQSYRPQCSFADYNGDGRADLIAEQTGLFAGGLREAITRFLTHPAVTHEVHVYFQGNDGVYSERPDVIGRFTIRLDAPPARNTELFRRYQAGELVDVTGDFNGDGVNDVCVQGRHGLSVYAGGESRIAGEPLATLDMKTGWRFAVADVDGDERADIVVRWVDPESAEHLEQSRVFLTREQAP